MAQISNRVVAIYNRKTSMRLAPCEWEAIEYICEKEKIPRKTLFELIDFNRDEKMGLTSAIRLFTIIYYKNAIADTSSQTQNNINNDGEFTSAVFEAIKGIV